MFIRSLLSLSIALLASTSAGASQVVNIPWSAAMPVTQNTDLCQTMQPFAYFAFDTECYVWFPISVPVGHTIQQIAVIHMTDSMNPNPPLIFAVLDTMDHAQNESQLFYWSSTNPVAANTLERRPLMQEIVTKSGTVYPDAFQVAPNTMYSVLVGLTNHGVSAIELTYN